MAKLRRIPPQPLPGLRPYTAEVQTLTDGLRELIRQSNKLDVTARAEIGARLSRVRTLLPHGSWYPWLEREVPFTPRSADSYIQLAHFAKGDPARFAKVAELGATKAYLFMRLPRPLFDRLFATPDHLIPSSRKRKTLALMTLSQLMEVVAHAQGRRTDSATKLVNTYRRQVHALVKTIELLLDNHEHIPATELEDLHDDLLTATHRLATLFTLEE